MNGRTVFGGSAKHLENFLVRSRLRVVDAHAHRERAALQTVLKLPAHLRNLLRRGRLMSRISGGQENARIANDFHAYRDVPDAYAIINERFAVAFRVPVVHIVGAHFQLQCGGYTVAGLKLIVPRLLSVFVQIDEAGRDDQSFGIEGGFAKQRSGRNRADFSANDSHISLLVQAGLGIHHAAVGNHHIKNLGLRFCQGEQREEQDACGRDAHGRQPS